MFKTMRFMAFFLCLVLLPGSVFGYELRTNTAVRLSVGPLVDPIDGKTAEVALDVTALSVQLYQIDGTGGGAVTRTQFTPTASGGANDMALVTSSTDGMYDLEVTAAQINWLGPGRISFYDIDGFLVHYIDLSIVSANFFNNKYGATIEAVNITQLGGVAQSATDLKDFADAGYDPATDKVQGVVLTDTLTTYTDDTPQTGDNFARIGATGSGLTSLSTQVSVNDIPNTSEFGLRTLPSADYTVVADLGTVQTGDSYPVVSHVDYGNAQLVRSTTPANTLDVSATGESGLDFDNIKDATGAHTLTNITVPVVTNTGTVTGNVDGTVAGVTPAETGDAMNLAADAIKAVSYDETTAWPVTAADTGATQIARVGADSDTLETLSDQIDLQSTEAKLLAYSQLILRSDAAIEADNVAELNEINADEGSGAGDFSSQTDSQEALADAGAGGGATAQQVWEYNISAIAAAGLAGTIVNDIPNTAEFVARSLVSADYTVVADLGTVQTGDNFARIGVNGAGLSNIDLPNQTMDIIGTITGNLAGDVTGNVDGTVAGVTPSVAGDAMNLAADAIKAVSYDETTAWPVTAADSGSTQIARTGADGDTLETISDQIDGLAAGSGLTALGSGTAQSGTASTIVLAAVSAFADDVLNGNSIKIHTGTGAGQSRVIFSNTLADDTCNIEPNWIVNPAADSQYEIVEGSSNVVAVSLTAQTANDNGADLSTITGADGTTLATVQGNYAPNIVVPDVAGTASGLHTTTDALINGLNNITSASVWAVGTRAITDKAGFSLAADQSAVTIGTVNSSTLANGAHGGGAATLVLSDYSNFLADVSALATTAELNKVPKSDGTSTWNATALASIQSESNDALVAYGPNTTVPDAAGTAAGLHGTTDGLIGALNDFDPANDIVANVTAVGTTTTNSDMRGTDSAALAASYTAARAGYLDNLNIGENVAGISDISGLNDLSVADIIAGISEGALDLQEILRIILSAVAGKANGGGTSTINFRDQADGINRITATVDGSGNRTAVTVDGS